MGPYRVYFVEGCSEAFRRKLAVLLAALDARGEVVEHLATLAVLDAGGRWRESAQVVEWLLPALTGPSRRPPAAP
jgi:hypothetical protein